MKIVLIRHGMTAGNAQKRYIGRTDEPLCSEGRQQLVRAQKQGKYPAADVLAVSPMKRCIETAKLLYPALAPIQVTGLRECDFGLFEGKNYEELQGNEAYQRWIDSGGSAPFPAGEAVDAFKTRSVRAFMQAVSEIQKRTGKLAQQSDEFCAAMVVHGGTIMSVLEFFCGGGYYDYHCDNGAGYICRLRDDLQSLAIIGRLMQND